MVHHTADNGPKKNTRYREAEHLRAMQYFHQNVRGWSDIAYNYLIMPSGRVYEGRGFGVRPAGAATDTQEWNTDSIHVSFVGTYETKEPSEKAVASYHALRKRLRAQGAKFDNTVGHGDLMPTSCPGKGVRRALGLRKPRKKKTSK